MSKAMNSLLEQLKQQDKEKIRSGEINLVDLLEALTLSVGTEYGMIEDNNPILKELVGIVYDALEEKEKDYSHKLEELRMSAFKDILTLLEEETEMISQREQGINLRKKLESEGWELYGNVIITKSPREVQNDPQYFSKLKEKYEIHIDKAYDRDFKPMNDFVAIYIREK